MSIIHALRRMLARRTAGASQLTLSSACSIRARSNCSFCDGGAALVRRERVTYYKPGFISAISSSVVLAVSAALTLRKSVRVAGRLAEIEEEVNSSLRPVLSAACPSAPRRNMTSYDA